MARFSSRVQHKSRSARKRTPVALYDPAAEAARSQLAKGKRKAKSTTPKKDGRAARRRTTPSPRSSSGPSRPPSRSAPATPSTAPPPVHARAPATVTPSSGPAPNIPSGVVDELCTTSGTLVTCPTGGLYEALLEYTDAATNSDKFYVLQLIQSSATGFHVFQRWGRRGAKGQQMTNDFTALDEAVKYFNKKFKAKTGVEFSERDAADLDGKYKMAKRLRDAGAGEGEVAISLIWENSGSKKNDLDLHVTAPSGETIYYMHKTSQCGGVLDVDRMQHHSEPVENIVWTKAPKGTYKVHVHNFSASHHGPTPFKVGIKIKDGDREMIDGVMPEGSASGTKKLVKQFTFN